MIIIQIVNRYTIFSPVETPANRVHSTSHVGVCEWSDTKLAKQNRNTFSTIKYEFIYLFLVTAWKWININY